MSQVHYRIAIMALAVAISPGSNSPATAEPSPENSEDDENPNFDAWIDALANRVNKPPEMIRGRGPKFSEEYDEDEQDRVVGVPRRVVKHNGRRTLARTSWHIQGRQTIRVHLLSVGITFAYNGAVGSICKSIAQDNLVYAYRRHAPVSNGKRGKIGHPLVGLPKLDMLTKCYERSKDKPLHELQIELCEWSITDASALEKLTDQEREKFVEKVKEQIATLKETRQPIVDKRLKSGWYVTYTLKHLQREGLVPGTEKDEGE